MTVSTFSNANVKSGDLNEIVIPATAAIQAGDMVYLSSGNAIAAGTYTWDTNLATTQGTFHDVFAGISQTSRSATDAHANVTVATTGECNMPCAALAAQHEIGEFVGPAKASDNHLDPQSVAIVANSSLAIGVLSRRALAGDTSMWFKLASTVGTPFQGTQTHT
jgi:hypothetical protein